VTAEALVETPRLVTTAAARAVFLSVILIFESSRSSFKVSRL
jgi:hypothetical protein